MAALKKKNANAAVVNDAVLTGEVAAQVCGSLGLSSTNATLGRKVVSLALAAMDREGAGGGMADGPEGFAEDATQYGALSAGMLREIYQKVAPSLACMHREARKLG
jgi:hypothetical protein